MMSIKLNGFTPIFSPLTGAIIAMHTLAEGVSV